LWDIQGLVLLKVHVFQVGVVIQPLRYQASQVESLLSITLPNEALHKKNEVQDDD